MPGQHTPFALSGHIQRGDMAPWWNQGPHRFIFDPFAGGYIVLGFFGTVGDAIAQCSLRALDELLRFVDDKKACFFCVSSDREGQTEPKLSKTFSSIHFVWDTDATMNRAYGIGSGRLWIVLNPMLRVVEVIPFRTDGADLRQLSSLIEGLPPPSRFLGFEVPAPVLVLPDVFESTFCRHLMDSYELHGGRESGFMQDVAGKAVEHYDPAWKRRKDHIITDEALIEQIKARIARRVGPMLQRAFHFKLTRMERNLVACYAAEDGGHFGPHRDDTVKATGHRRFAVSINLNDNFDGGELSFPEFGSQLFKAPVGAALIFSSSLLHRVSMVTVGRRYAFLPFLHDEEAESIRRANLRFLTLPV
jgi:predicted 2-oxoglutarate/Fe(II)-dependent dioxygenase YbiX